MAADVAIIDYGVGNLRSVQKAFAHMGHDAIVTGDAAVIAGARRVVLPGVGAFGAGTQLLRERDLWDVTVDAARSGRPFLGICVGMQLLFDAGEEMGTHVGLGLLAGRVVRFDVPGGAKIPQIGWNNLHFPHNATPIFEGIVEGEPVYFLHSFRCNPESEGDIAATTDFHGSYCSAVARGNLFGVQFHPEKSGAAGLRILDNFARL